LDNQFKKLLNDIKCGRTAAPMFTEDDLAKVKACLPEPVVPPPSNVNVTVPETDSCVNDGIEEVKKIMIDQLSKQGTLVELSAIKGKLEEALDHYKIISVHYRERYRFFNDTITTLAPFTSEFIYWDDEFNRLKRLEESIYNKYREDNAPDKIKTVDPILLILNWLVKVNDKVALLIFSGNLDELSKIASDIVISLLLSSEVYKSYSTVRKARIEAGKSRTRAKTGATNALKTKIQSIPNLGLATVVKANALAITNQISGQLIPIFNDTDVVQPITQLVTSARSLAYEVRLLDLDRYKITVPQVKADGSSEQIEKTINIRTSPYLKFSPFANTIGTALQSREFQSGPPTETDYAFVPGALYNQTNGYAGLYKKLANPVRYLYTPEERGLTVDPNKIDPILTDVENAPKSITEEDTTFYIANQAQYSKFYDEAAETLPDKLKNEREVVFPKQIEKNLEALKTLGQAEAADFFRRTTDSEVKLARPLTYKAKGSNIYLAGEFTYSVLDKVISSRLAYYTKAADEIDQKIKDLQADIDQISELITQNSMDPDVLAKRISTVACFKDAAKAKATAKDCEEETKKKLGSDPLMIRTLSGTDSSLPDMNNPCYWKEFANSLNQISLLPIPDVTSPLLRYWPINNIIPTPVGVVMIPMPQKWRVLFSLSSPLGTLVTFLTLPALIVGIPLPSVYMFYFSPDGNKYMLLAPNFPLVFAPGAIKYGFEIDTSGESDNPIGLSNSNPHKGQLVKGSLTVPIKVTASSSRAARLAAFAATIAQGKNPSINTPDGRVIKEIDPQFYLQNYLGQFEASSAALDGGAAEEFINITTKFKADLNAQFKILGDMQINAVTQLKEKTRSTRQKEVVAAEDINDPKDRLAAKDKARGLDPVRLTEKIQSVLSDFESYIDKINLGTIAIPKNATRLNPKLPGAVTAVQPIIEKASRGELTPDPKAKNLISMIKKFASQIDPSKLDVPKKEFNLNKLEDVAEFKNAIKKFANEALAHATGDKTTDEDIDPKLPEERKAEIAKANEQRKKRIKAAFALSSLALSPPTLKLFDPSAPCCATDSAKPNDLPSPQVLAAIAIFNALLDAFLQGITIDTLKSMFGEAVSNIGIDTVKALFDSALSAFPPIPIPELPSVVAIFTTMILPVLTATHIPQAPIPLGPVFPVPIIIPLNEVIKPLLKAAIAYLLELLLRLLSDAGSMLAFTGLSIESPTLQEIIKQVPCGDSQFATVSTTNISRTVSVKLPNGIVLTLPKIPNIPLDIVSYFALLTSTDLVELIRGLLFAAIDGILEPLKSIVVPILNIAQSFKDLSLNIIEAANPFILPIKLIILALQLKIPNSSKTKLMNLEAINLIRAAYLPVVTATEPILKETAYLFAILAPAFASKPGVKIARIAANPFVNQDDLPPWERLTYKNPLFAIFLDEIAWRSSLTSTGSLIFATKMPGIFTGARMITKDPGIH
jgi:hypothetical protein